MFSLKGGIGHVRGSPIEQFVAEYDHPSIWAKTLGSRPIEYSTWRLIAWSRLRCTYRTGPVRVCEAAVNANDVVTRWYDRWQPSST